MSIDSARQILEQSIIYCRGEPVGTSAAADPNPVAKNYEEVFIRDFVPSAIYFLMRDQTEIVRNLLREVMHLRGQQVVLQSHQRSAGLPASFRVIKDADGERLEADFGNRAIGGWCR